MPFAEQNSIESCPFDSNLERPRMTICCHSDAALANVGAHTQAGFILAFVDKTLQDGRVSTWSPAVWKSYKMSRAVSSTLAGESQALATASGTVEWLSLMISEAFDGPFDPRQSERALSSRPPILATDCKSLYDRMISPSSPTAVEDRRASIDIVILRESVRKMRAWIRWLPANRMIADGLTKDKADPIDLLRSSVRNGSYQISPEEHVIQLQSEERERRLQNKSRSPTVNASLDRQE